MVGDNVEADIECPVELGWDTILVKTGVNKHHF
jgi:ribonucleotide monophosphatase NagD (HAD superfamily)